ncbi:A24 family peptidase [Nocardioides sp. InS609-2]|uniref:prepilin peptidase n=1 Tax=Nocardioides sp. InS609-2 TaxID=2760705 RepID=UPI0020C0909E|nr:A24 family peptidase [Nocardioides sp. InS609-2]
MSLDLTMFLVSLAVCGVAGLGVPTLVRAVPEPENDDEPKELYADVAALPGLAWKAALFSAVIGGVVAATVGATWHLLVLLPLVPVGVALGLVDWRTRLLPTRIIAPTYALVIVGVLVVWAVTGDTSDLARAGLGWVIAGFLFFVLWFVHPRGLGYGDVRLSGILGIALGHVGWGELFVGVYAGFLLGGVGGLLLSRLRIVERKDYPFGPFMLVGVLVGLLVGPAAAAYYNR